MVTQVFSVARLILDQCGEMTAMKLQKLCYYAQAWHLVLRDEPLFRGRIEAWANGPVVIELYQRHRGMFTLSADLFRTDDPNILNRDQKNVITSVLNAYAHLSASELSRLTHSEAPWMNARAGLMDGQRGNKEITYEAMAGFYSAQQS